jgi:hypothetical protein
VLRRLTLLSLTPAIASLTGLLLAFGIMLLAPFARPVRAPLGEGFRRRAGQSKRNGAGQKYRDKSSLHHRSSPKAGRGMRPARRIVKDHLRPAVESSGNYPDRLEQNPIRLNRILIISLII